MFDVLKEAIKGQPVEIGIPPSDLIKGRHVGVGEAISIVPGAVEVMIADETRRMNEIATSSDVIVNPNIVQLSPDARLIHDENTELAQYNASNPGFDRIDLHEPDMPINVHMFNRTADDAERRVQIASVTEARNRIKTEHLRLVTDPLVERFEALPTDPVAEVASSQHEADTEKAAHLSEVRAKLEAIFGTSSTQTEAAPVFANNNQASNVYYPNFGNKNGVSNVDEARAA